MNLHAATPPRRHALHLFLVLALSSLAWSNPLPIQTPAVKIELGGDADNWEDVRWKSAPDGKTIHVFYWGDLFDDSLQPIDFKVDVTFTGQNDQTQNLQWLVKKVGDQNFNQPIPTYLKNDLSVKASQQTTLLYSLTTGTETVANLKLIFVPVTFELFGLDDAGIIPGEQAPNRKPHQLNMRTKMNEAGHYGDYRKCVPVIWSEAGVDLSKFLAGYAFGAGIFTNPDLLNWREVGQPDVIPGFILDLGNPPDADEMQEHRIEVIYKNGNIVADRLILTVIPANTEISFQNWVAGNGVLPQAWTNNLPTPYAALAANRTDPEPPPPAVACERWASPKVQSSFYHPGSSFEMRSDRPGPDVGPGHQACYDATGKIILEGISAGTADRASPSLVNGDDHLNFDVKPYIWAAQLDGNPVQGLQGFGLPFRDLNQPILHAGNSLLLYLARRPPHVNAAPLLPPLNCVLQGN